MRTEAHPKDTPQPAKWARLAIIGHPRCGTGYASRAFKQYGLEIGHETLERDGIVAWSWSACAADAPWCSSTPRVRATQVGTLLHVVRDPAQALWSIAYAWNSPEATEYLSRFAVQLPGWSPLDNAALSFLSWNKLCAAQAPEFVVRVEHFREDLKRQGFPYPLVQREHIPRNVNSQPKCDPPSNYGSPVGPLLLPEVRSAINAWCEEYGYGPT